MKFVVLKRDDTLDRYSCPHCGHGDFRILPTTRAEWNKIEDKVQALSYNLELKVKRGEANDDEFLNQLAELFKIIIEYKHVFPETVKILRNFVVRGENREEVVK